MPRSRVTSKTTTEFGHRVRARRERRGLSQMALAELAEVHFTYISDIERGVRNPSLITMVKLAAALDTDLGKLVKDLPPV
ncbi:MAG: helix-turn-helix transcriptional regulator [Actinomycetia bacterium]|nr:helix-turn-helix transcriptional regulator [Actinomycetes bacterium]